MFSRLIGNSLARNAILRMISGRRVPNALLFAGPEGVGKRQFAIELAKSFVCTTTKDFEACDLCSACQRASKFVIPDASDKSKDEFKRVIFSEHADVGTVVTYNRNILVDAIRDLEREAYFRPYEADYRFFIIDDADKLNDSAANALLKTLEEPASSSHIVLVTSRPDTLLQTIRSRCQTIRFAPVEFEKIEEFLDASGRYSGDEAALAARLSGGSIGRASSLDLDKFRQQRDSMNGVLENVLIRRDLASLLQIAEQMNDAKNKEDYESNLGILEALIRDIWLILNQAGTDGLTNFDIADTLAGLAGKTSSSQLAAWLAEIENIRQTFVVNINRKTATDALFMKMAAV